MQRLSFHCPFGPAAVADPSPPLRLRLAAQELAVYGGAVPVTAGVPLGSGVHGVTAQTASEVYQVQHAV